MNECEKSGYEEINDLQHMQVGSNTGALVVHPIVGPENGHGLALVPLNHMSWGFDIGKC